ncbi:zinc finger FYVE domain-containing protein 26-like isoform X2 [Ornithodoros turicata]|uniref:zinc finger FYVE domain-containing protein 26-like isoform X2 n=1 Tax=Ornithodoros turicata TaxID=34597 RepID=UPI00313A0B9E
MGDEEQQNFDYDDVIASNANLLTEFRCHVYLGQWELARACALTVLRAPYTTDEDRQFVRNYVKELAVCPEAVSTCASPSVISPHHLSWRASKFLEENFPEEDASGLKNHAEFRVLLHRVGKTYPEECREELHRLYREASSSRRALSIESCTCLYNSLLESTYETYLFLTFLLQALPEDHESAFQIRRIYLKAELHLLKQLKVSWSKSQDTASNVQKAALHILSLIPESTLESLGVCSESKTLLETIFADLIDLLNSGALKEGEVFGSMVCRKTPRLLQVFSDKLNDCKGRRKIVQPNEGVEDYTRLAVSLQTGELDIKEAFLKSVISGEHFARTLTKYAVQKIIQGDVETAKRLFTNQLLCNLFPAALYLAWSKVSSDASAQNVMQAVQDSKGWVCPDQILQNLLERMQYNLTVTRWILNVYKERKPDIVKAQERSFLRNTYDMLLRLSPLAVLHKTLGLKHLNRDDVQELLESAPMKEKMHGPGEAKAQTRSSTPDGQEETSECRSNSPDAVLYRGYLALQRAMDAFYVAVLLNSTTSCDISTLSAAHTDDADGNNIELWELAHDSESVAAAVEEHGFSEVYRHTVLAQLQHFQEEVSAVHPLTFRLELLEDTFSLLFVTQADMRDDQDKSTAEDTDYNCDSDEELNGTFVDESFAVARDVQGKVERRPSASRQAGGDGVSTKGSTASSSGGGYDAGGVSGAGFLCPHFLVPDILRCLSNAIIATQATAFAVGATRDKPVMEDPSPVMSTCITWKEFPTRLEALNKYVVEAQWRYDLVASSSDFGKHSRTFGAPSSLQRADKTESRRHRRRRKRMSITHINSDGATVIEKMLSTFEALLRHCLWHGNYRKAHQIVELLDLGSSPDAQELLFCEGLLELKQHLAQNSGTPSPHPPLDFSKASTVSAEMGRAAQAGLRLTSATSLVDRFFGSVTVPCISEAEQVLRSSPEEQPSAARWLVSEYGGGGLRAAAIADLAITGKLPCDVSERILAMAKNQHHSDVKHVPSGTKWRGLSATIDRIRQLLQESSDVEVSGGMDRMLFAPGATNTLTDLLCGYIGDMDPRVLRVQRRALRELGEQFHEVKLLLKASEASTEGRPDKNKLHKAFFQLTEMSGKPLRSQLPFLPAFRFDYFRCTYAHVRQLHKAVCDVARQGRLKVKRPGGNYFWVLSQSPSALLSDMIFKDEIHPVRLEELAKRMKINLVQVIAKACCPQIELRCCDNISELPKGSVQYLEIMNESSSPCATTSHPNYVVKCLLRDLIVLLKAQCDFGECVVTLRDVHQLGNSSEFADWASRCAELGSVDLEQLSDNVSRLAFFLNLVNLVTLHVAIVQASGLDARDVEATHFVPITSPYAHQRLIEEMHCGYRVGQLGVVTLFELKRQILFQGYPLDDISGDDFLLSLLEELHAKASNKYSPNIHPKVVYSLVQGRISDPKLEIINPETLEEQFQNAVARCMAQIKALSTDGKRKIIFPWQMKFFINTRIDLDESSEELRDSLQRLVPEGFLVEFEKEKPTFGIVLDLPIPQDDLQSVDSSVRIPPAVLSYLENRSPLLGQVIKFMQPKVAQQFHIGDGTHSQSPLENLLRQYYTIWAQLATQSGHGPWLSLALEGRASGNLIWEALQGAAAQKDAVSALALLDLADAVEGLQQHPDLMAYQQALLWMLASQSGEESSESAGTVADPWRYALCIRDLNSKAECVLANYIRWPDNHGVSTLKKVLAECSPESQSSLHERLSRELFKITLYKEIKEQLTDTSHGAFGSWRDVARYSLSDPALVLEQLSDGGCYECATQWADLHDVPLHCQAVVTELRVLNHLHRDPPDSSAAFQIICSAETEEASFLLCQNALRKLANGQGKIDALDFVLDKYSHCLTEETALMYQKLCIGLRMFICISPRKRDDYADLVSCPTFLLEQLLMNTEIDCVGECLKLIAPFLEREGSPLTRAMADGYLEKYASKALELLLLPTSSSEPDTTLPSSGTSASPQGQNETFVMPAKPPPTNEWIPDENVARCMVCQEEHFGVFSRRHHCRRCGRVVCSSCSQQTMCVEGYGKRNVRVCDDCFEQTTNPPSLGVEAIPPELPPSQGLRYNPNDSPSPSALRPPRKSTPLQAASRDDSSSKGNAAWILHVDDEENVFTREHFYYERAPSVSLCLSILARHSSLTRCSSFILSLCDNLFTVLAPKAACDTLVDYGLIISIMHSLMLNAKVKCEEAGHSVGVEWCEAYLRRLDIVQLMVTNNCQHLIPDEMLLSKTEAGGGLDPKCYWQPERKLRDRLTEAERMELALEVATKCRLEKSGIFASWGLALLRVGDWAAAREKFSLCLQRPKERGKSAVENPLLQEIIASLEKSSYAGHSKAAAVFCAIGSLRSIRDPNIEVKFSTTELKSQVFSECKFYLERYGTHRSMLEFLLRHHEIEITLKYFLAENCESELLAENVIVPALERGDIEQVLSGIKRLDPTLIQFWPSLLVTCRHLQRNGLFHCLYHMQLFMEDYIRAAMTSIQFFERPPTKSYSDLHGRLQHLANASKHFEAYLEKYATQASKQKSTTERQVLEMPPNEVSRHLSMVKLQVEVTRFLHSRETENELILPIVDNGGRDATGSWSIPTLFGSIARKCELTCLILTNGKTVDEGFGIAFRIIEEHLLSGAQIFQRTSSLLQHFRGAAQVKRLVDCIATCGYPKKYDVDAVVMVAVKVIVNQDEEKKDLEILVKCLKSDVNKIEAYMLAGRLKSAYLLAVRQNRTEHIRRIMALAEEANQESIRAICEKRLQALEQR